MPAIPSIFPACIGINKASIIGKHRACVRHYAKRVPIHRFAQSFYSGFIKRDGEILLASSHNLIPILVRSGRERAPAALALDRVRVQSWRRQPAKKICSLAQPNTRKRFSDETVLAARALSEWLALFSSELLIHDAFSPTRARVFGRRSSATMAKDSALFQEGCQC